MGQLLERVFNPRSIAIIGASEVPGKAAERRTRSLLEGGFKGKVYPINPKRDTIFGMKAYPDIKKIDGSVDLVMVVIPPKFIPAAVAGSIEKGAKGIVIITAGLGESGAEGKKIETEILQMAHEAGTYVMGPNCSGMFSGTGSLNILGIPNIAKGHVSVLAQSGNIIDSLTHYAKIKRGGFSKIISAGNAIGVKFHQYIEYLGEDPDTHVIALYLEGITEGNAFVRAARDVSKKKPIVALKVGRTGAGARAAMSHTGSLAGDDVVVDAAFRQAGIIRVSNPDELFDIARFLEVCPSAQGTNLAILSEGGGDNSVAADNAERHGVQVPIFAVETQNRLRPYLLTGMPASNPIDYGGTAEENPHMITECCKVCMEDPAVHGVYITGFYGGFRDIIAPHVAELEEKTAHELAALVNTHKKPLVINTSFANAPYPTLEILKENNIPVFDGPERAMQCMAALMHFCEDKEKRKNEITPRADVEVQHTATRIIDTARQERRSSLLEPEAMRLLQAYGLPIPPGELAADVDEAVQMAHKIGFPVVLKVVSQDILHKSDVGGVKVNLADGEAVRQAYENIMANALKVTEQSRIKGVLVTPMAAKGQECIVGMTVDPIFGPVMMFGLGGIFVEVLKDVAFRVAPLTLDEVAEMVAEIKGFKVLTGVRGEPPKDIEAIKEVIQKLSYAALAHPEIKEIDLNPVIVHEQGISLVDSRIIISNKIP
jgi:acyl-CoA synthetase (NDP forming)